jgi:glycosyltransferase involved in cell wall biosynthesis
VSIVSGICVEHDAISNLIALQRQVLADAGYRVQIFVQHNGVLDGDGVIVGNNPWGLASDPSYQASDLVIFHYGIRYELFDALLLHHPRAVRVVHFHNITPPEFVAARHRDQVLRSFDQIVLAERADVIWSDSEHNSDVLAELTDVDRRAIRLVELCVPGVTATQPPSSAAPPDAPVRLAAVGRFVPAKGLHDVVDAIALLGPDVGPVSLAIAGSTPPSDPDYLADLRARIVERGLSDVVEIVLDAPDDEIARLYGRTDVLVTGSYHEGFCVPIVEALAAGCRVVATDAGALADTVGSCGELVPVSDPAALAAAITRAVADVRTSRRPGLAGPAEERFDEVARHLARFSLPAFRRRLLHEVGRLLQPPAHEVSGGDPAVVQDAVVARQKLLLDRLACPRCHRPLAAVDAVWSHDALVVGDLTCEEHGRVGVVDAYRPSFLDRELDAIPAGRGAGRTTVRLSLPLTRATRVGRWDEVPQGLRSADGEEASLSIDVAGSGVALDLLGHPWGGTARVVVDEEVAAEVDTHRPTPEPLSVELDLDPGDHVVHVVATGARHDDAAGAQLVVAGVAAVVAADAAPLPWSDAVNRGNPYPPRFDALLAAQPPDAVVLDCGGGDRRYGDPRVFNMEYLDFGLPDLFGDGLHLPFADDSIDLILSQAVLEHVPDPQRALDEMVRVLRPGGQIYLEIAFMQPLHAVPYHYFNVTPHGIDHLCRSLERIDSGTFGGLEDTIRWIGGLLRAEERLGAERFSGVLDALRALDRQLEPGELDAAASAVFFLGRKPA